MPDTVHLIPLAEIDDAALARDRTALDAEALTELRLSIAASGLRMPVELFALAPPAGAPDAHAPAGPHRYGLLSGFRRVAAFRALHELTDDPRYAAIPAFLRAPASLAAALAAMVEENEIRADLSPFERGRIAVTARDQGIFGTIEEAVNALYPNANAAKRTRLRTLARLAEEMDGHLTAPESLSQQHALRLAAALRAGFGELIRTALAESRTNDPAAEWQILLPIILEAERTPVEPTPSRPGRPRRVLHIRPGLTLRREMTPDGYILRFTGRDASSALMDAVIDEVERIFSPG